MNVLDEIRDGQALLLYGSEARELLAVALEQEPPTSEEVLAVSRRLFDSRHPDGLVLSADFLDQWAGHRPHPADLEAAQENLARVLVVLLSG